MMEHEKTNLTRRGLLKAGLATVAVVAGGVSPQATPVQIVEDAVIDGRVLVGPMTIRINRKCVILNCLFRDVSLIFGPGSEGSVISNNIFHGSGPGGAAVTYTGKSLSIFNANIRAA